MVEIKIKGQSPASPPAKNVTFQQEPSEDEKAVVKSVAEVLGMDAEKKILRTIRKHNKKCVNSPDFVSEIINRCMDQGASDEEEETKVSTVANKPEPEISTQTDSMEVTEVIPYGPQQRSKNEVPLDKEDRDLQKALQESLAVSNNSNLSTFRSSLPEDLETMIRNPNLSTGLHNAGNTCWFNCVAQILYHLPKFRSMIYHCIPYKWQNTSKLNVVTPETVLTRDLLMAFRAQFAEMQFSTASYIDTNHILEIVDALTRKSNSSESSVLGQQQDATESLIRIIDWLDNGIKEALNERNNPKYEVNEYEEEDQSYIPANSVAIAPNSDVMGMAPPSYDDVSYTAIESTSKCSTIKREPESRTNSPVRMNIDIPFHSKKLAVSSPKSSYNDEPMDITEEVKPEFAVPFLPTSPKSQTPELSIDEMETLELIKNNMEKLFTATCVTATYSDEISNSLPETRVTNFPQFFHLQASYGDLHDALEATTFDTGRGDSSQVQNFFETLPAAIFMGISRFNYKNNMPEKLHNRFVFPRTLYMDRYMKKNAKKVLELRNQRNANREILGRNRALQRGLKNYPTVNNQTTRIVDTIETVINVLNNTHNELPPPTTPKSPNVLGPFLSVSPTPSQDQGSLFIENMGTKYPEIAHNEFPAMNECLQTLQQIFEKLKNEEKALIEEDARLLEEINNAYDIEELKQVEYRLHAAIIHSGEANRGHYWTYAISQDKQWEKLNDKNIEIVPWSQVENDAFGNGNASSPSAYCLLYIKSDATWLMEPDTLTREEAIEFLPTDLKDLVDDKIESFALSLDRFREKRRKKFEKDTFGTRTIEEDTQWNLKKEQWGETPKSHFADENTASSSDTIGLTTPLYQQPCEKFDGCAERSIKDSTSRISRIFKEITPRTFVDEATILENHCDSLMVNYGRAFLKQILQFDPSDLRAHAENDANSAYDKFIANFLENYNDCKLASNCIVSFAHTIFRNFTYTVTRYMLLIALSRANITIISEKATAEIELFKLQSHDYYISINRLAQWVAMLYELLAVVLQSCRKSLEFFLREEIEYKGSHNSYNGLLSARLARYCYQHLVGEIRNFENGWLNLESLIDYSMVQMTTTLSLLKLSIELVSCTADENRTFHDLTFFLDEKERRISEDDLSRELIFAINALKIWVKCNIGTVLAIHNSNVEVYNSLQTSFEVLHPLRACSINAEKQFLVNGANQIFNEERIYELDILPQNIECEANIVIPHEMSIIGERIGDLMKNGSLENKYKQLLLSLQNAVSQSY